MRILLILLAACSSSSTPPAKPVVATTPPDAAAIPVDAPPDAGPSAELAGAPAWIFRFHAADRVETWTLRTTASEAMLVVERAAGTTTYLGASPAELTAGAQKMSLTCKKDRIPLCSNKKTIEVQNCMHPDFKTPMAFAPAPGIEFDATASCYRKL